MDQSLVRNEFKYDLFRGEFNQISRDIERDYMEIERPAPTTLTLFFNDPDLGPPDIDTHFRLRSYAHLDPNTITLADIKAQSWQMERKDVHVKQRLGILNGLPESSDEKIELYDLLGTQRRPNILKVTRRRHFAVADETDEYHRITLDLSRTIFKVVDKRLERLGDMSPRVEIKLPLAESEDSLPVSQPLQAQGHWTPFAALELYFQYLLRCQLPMDTHKQLPEIESKFAVTFGTPQQMVDQLSSWLPAQQGEWDLLLPYPHSITRVRRYHVCEGPDPNLTYTVVETSAGRCSLKVKENARQEGTALLRETRASHTTDLDGAMMMPDEFIRAAGLQKLNEFTKSQRKFPIALQNGRAFQFSLDQCWDPVGRKLNQLEIEFIGSAKNEQAPKSQVIEEIDRVAAFLLASAPGQSLEQTLVAKHTYFSQAA